MINIKEVRAAAGMNQREFCLALGISRPTLSKYELGKMDPGPIEKKVRQFIVDNNLDDDQLDVARVNLSELSSLIAQAKMAYYTFNEVISKLEKYIV